MQVQADVCHAYQLLRKGGLKEENIVVFMYDDIAMHELNPRPGVIINHPQGDNVYAGVPKVNFTFLSFIKTQRSALDGNILIRLHHQFLASSSTCFSKDYSSIQVWNYFDSSI